MRNKLQDDLDEILNRGESLWQSLGEEHFFITGGTGFIGTWLLESFAWLNDRRGLNMRATVLTRDADAFAEKAPHLANRNDIDFHLGDVRSFAFPDGRFSYVIHGATDASARLNAEEPLRMFDTIVEGTRRTLDFSVQCGAKKFLFVGSGAVYGEQPASLSCNSESDFNSLDCADAGVSYAEGKRAAELLCVLYAKQFGIDVKLARCFAFVGPYLPLDTHFAIGNFIRDAMAGNAIQINGDGTPYRSYLYAADLTYWLWVILLNGQTARPYNVGASRAVSIAELGEMVNSLLGGKGVNIGQQPRKGVMPKRYVPSVERAERELGLAQTCTLEQAIIKTAHWHGAGIRE